MGNVGATACCNQRRSDFDYDLNDFESTYVVSKLRRPGRAIKVAYTEWEEIIALSRAYAPGGKLLGLSSTKKLIATLHEVGEGLLQKYEINVWELHRADRGLLNGKNNMGGINNNMKQRKNFGAATPKLEVAVHCPSLTEIGRATDGHGGKVEASTSKIIFVNSIEFLDSSQPRYLASTLSYLKNFVVNSFGQGLEKGTMTYGIKVWQIFPKPRTYQDVMGASPTSRRDTNNSEGNENSKSNSNVLHAKRELREVLEIEHPTEITAFTTLRQYMFIGDNAGTIRGFYWENWHDIEWRRVSRNRKKNRGFKGASNYASPNFNEMKLQKLAHESEQAIEYLKCVCGADSVHLYSAGREKSGLLSIRIWFVKENRIDILHKNIILPNMRTVSHILLGQTPDVGASWYAPSHGHHKLEAPKENGGRRSSKRGSTNGNDKDKNKKRGMRPHFPPFMFIAGQNKRDEYCIQKWFVRAKKGKVPEKRLDFKPTNSEIVSISFGPYNNGPLVTGMKDNKMIIWDSSYGEILKSLDGCSGTVNDIVVEPNCHAWSVDDYGEIVAWRLDGQGEKIIRNPGFGGT